MDSILRSGLGRRMRAPLFGALGLACLLAGSASPASAQEGVAAKGPAAKAPAAKAPAAPKADAPPPGPATSKEEDIRMAQTILNDLGLYEGEVDGKLNADTAKALKEFQGEAGLEATGALDQFTTDALLEVMESIEEEDQIGGFMDEDEEGDADDEEEDEGPPPQCRGYNLETENPVAGSCSADGKFDGEDEETGSAVTGKCKAGGDLDGQDVATKQRVAGTCG